MRMILSIIYRKSGPTTHFHVWKIKHTYDNFVSKHLITITIQKPLPHMHVTQIFELDSGWMEVDGRLTSVHQQFWIALLVTTCWLSSSTFILNPLVVFGLKYSHFFVILRSIATLLRPNKKRVHSSTHQYSIGFALLPMVH